MNYHVMKSDYLRPYAFFAFPGLSGEIISSLMLGGASPAIVGAVLISIITLLTQGIADVVWPNGVKAPLGGNNWLAAPSGFGKSLILKILIEPVQSFLAVDADDRHSQRYQGFLIEEANRESIIQSLKDWPVAGLFNEESAELRTLLKSAVPTLAKLLDAAPLRSARVSTGRVALPWQRFCMLFMEQPGIFEATKSQLGLGKGGVGLQNRIFFTHLDGSTPALHQVALSKSVKSAYEKKVRELLGATVRQIEKQTNDRPALQLTAEAAQYLISLDNNVRRNCAPGAPWFSISEYASRHAERVLRLAGAFHVFENGDQGEISLDIIQRSDMLGHWYIESFMQIFDKPPAQTQVQADAIKLEHAIRWNSHTHHTQCFRQADLRTHAVNLGLTSTRFSRALAVLAESGVLRVYPKRGTTWIELNMQPFF